MPRHLAVLAALHLVAGCGGGGGSPPPPVPHAVSGTIRASGAQLVDWDTSDRNAAGRHNDTTGTAQPLPSAVTVGGWASATADLVDTYRVTLAANQALALSIADFDPTAPAAVDLDLCIALTTDVANPSCSLGLTPTEALQVSTAGEYFVEVSATAGASNYVLTIGAAPAAALAPTLRTDLEFVPGEVLVRFKDSALSPAAAGETLQARAAALGLRPLGGALHGQPALLGLPSGAEARAAALDGLGAAPRALGALGGTPDGLAAARLDTLRAVKALRARADVESADPNYVFHPSMVPTDPYYQLQWHYPLINLPQAWDVTTGAPATGGVVVAVVDTGVFLAHPDLVGQLAPGYDFISDPARARDGDGRDANPDDPGDAATAGSSSWHGTHVAGTVAAALDGAGAVGVAPGAKVMPIRALGVGGGTSADIIQGLYYAARLPNASGTLPAKRADVINLSIGCLGCASATEQAVYDQVVGAGVIVVAAAGNENSTSPSYPASYGGVVSVAAVDLALARAPYSNRGPNIDLAAPGGDTSQDRDGNGYADGVLSTLVNDSTGTRQPAWTFYQGTSMASPHVAGVVALMKSVCPGLTPADLDAIIQSGDMTRDLGVPGRDDSFGWGLVDALGAVRAAQARCGTAPAGGAQVTPGRLDFSPGVTSLPFAIAWNGAGLKAITGVTDDATWLTISAAGVDANLYGTYTATVDPTGLPAGRHSATATFTLAGGTTAALAVTLLVNAPSTASDAGFIYLLLVDPVPPPTGTTMTTLKELSGRGVGGVYGFEFTDLQDGEYLLVAGTDSDEDLLICDAGEACGAWPTLGVATPVKVSGADVTGLDFLVGFDVALGGASTRGTAPAAGFRRLGPSRSVAVKP